MRQKTTCVGCTAPLDIIALHADALEGGVRYCFGGYYDCVAEALLYGDDHEIEGAPEAGVQSLTCPACHDVSPVRWPDATTQLWDPRLWCLIGDAGEVATPAEQPVMTGTVVNCGNCGGGLVQEGRRRALVCAHCNASNFLADAVWTKLFPLPEDHRFYLVYRLDDETLERMYGVLDDGKHYFFEDDGAPQGSRRRRRRCRKGEPELPARFLHARVRRLTRTDAGDLDRIRPERGTTDACGSRPRPRNVSARAAAQRSSGVPCFSRRS